MSGFVGSPGERSICPHCGFFPLCWRLCCSFYKLEVLTLRWAEVEGMGFWQSLQNVHVYHA